MPKGIRNTHLTVDVNGVTSRACHVCLVVKPLSEYYRNSSSKFGRMAKCKACYYLHNLEQKRAYFARKRDELKAEVIGHYGGICFCCGEANIRFLTLDHVNNDGGAQRKANPKIQLGGRQFYYWLRQHGYPAEMELQVACFNCNCGRQYNSNQGVCPHEEERQSLGETNQRLRLVA